MRIETPQRLQRSYLTAKRLTLAILSGIVAQVLYRALWPNSHISWLDFRTLLHKFGYMMALQIVRVLDFDLLFPQWLNFPELILQGMLR